jgi:hypothetical protein
MRLRILTGVILATLLWGCRPGEPVTPPVLESPATPEFSFGEFEVQTVEASVEGEGPADVTLTVGGMLSDACTQIDSVSQERMGNLVSVHITTRREKDTVCVQVLAPHREVIRLGTFADPGSYTIKVNSVQTVVLVGTIPEEPVGGYADPVNRQYTTPDGSLTLSAPTTWQVQVTSGSIVVAATTEAISQPEAPSAARVSVTIVSGPHRAADFGIDGLTLREAFVFLVVDRGLMVGPPKSIEDERWPTLWQHASSPATGDVDLRVLSIDAETVLAILAHAPPGEWASFEPLFQAILASLDLS